LITFRAVAIGRYVQIGSLMVEAVHQKGRREPLSCAMDQSGGQRQGSDHHGTGFYFTFAKNASNPVLKLSGSDQNDI
jgi:hypothetical protein